MRVTTFSPSGRLAPFVRAFTIVESDREVTRVLMPETGLIAGLRFSGSATQLDGAPERMPEASIAGFRTTTRHMQTSADGGVVLAMFREGGAAQFFAEPLHEIHGRTIALDDVMPHSTVDDVQSRIGEAKDHATRIAIFEEFLLTRQLSRDADPIVTDAVRAIRTTHGALRIRQLARRLGVAQDPLEKRFRRVVGASPKQYASIIRLRHAIALHRSGASLTRAAIDAGYFDQSHFNRDFRSMTGVAPQQFFKSGEHC